MAETVELMLGCAWLISGMTPTPIADTKLRAFRQDQVVIAECEMKDFVPPTPKEGDLSLHFWKRRSISGCKLLNGATWDEVMEVMTNAIAR